MKLDALMDGTGAEMPAGSARKLEIRAVTQDSRKVGKGDLFVAVPGATVDGAQFAPDAMRAGAAAILAEAKIDVGVPCVVVPDARRALALVAANFYGKPAEEITLLGVTGTNGKTTTAFLLESMCAAGRASVGLLGTVQYRFSGKTVEASHTTPDALELHRLLREMVDAGIDTVVMEVSSHALAQQRVHGLVFRAAAFTNLTRDHLDYHKDVEDYFQAKRRLFTEFLSGGGVAVVNGDDTFANRIYTELRGQKGPGSRPEGRMAWKFSVRGEGEISAAGVEFTLSGTRGTLKTPAGDIPFKSSLVGAHNLENILAATGVALGAGLSRRDVQEGIERLRRVPGRMEVVEDRGVAALVDYAHTDDALRRSLEALRPLTRGRLFCVFGCGGDRDRGKRPLMGQAAGEGADLVIVTSDNPRTEDPDEIISEIAPGLEKVGLRRMSPAKARAGEKGYLVEVDRRAALALAASLAKPGDAILVAGKGHETYQIIGTEKNAFDDRVEVERALQERSSGSG
ncbi:MAG TPA: UDP-N-acetylmuramoyl-L-alanyl-D-glutamate--2,6-diaminopimelate ligase [Myxococcaceae bacterium]|nr:UDP-N-acetylmuramoyl-L-alanyl-D-glutamate--2,6-diaminopimelate ligase [Myxococcaceae bacterium]